MFARLLCSVVRTIEQRHRWNEEYPFDKKQRAAGQELREDDRRGRGGRRCSEGSDSSTRARIVLQEAKKHFERRLCVPRLSVSSHQLDQGRGQFHVRIGHHKYHR